MLNKKTLKRKIKFIKEPLLSYLKKEHYRRSVIYARYYDKLTVVKNTIFYESRDGKSISDNPFAIFQYLLKDPNFSSYKHIWSVDNFDMLKPVIDKYKDYSNVYFVQRNSKEYLKYLATCEYLFNNSTFQPYFTPKQDQIYINTWHGTPLKKMGYDIPGNPSGPQNIVRNFLSTSYLISPNVHTTNMYLNSFKLNGIYNGKIIEDGYPRIDLTLNTDANEILTNLKNIGLSISSDKKTILYAPTWKGKDGVVRNDIEHIIKDLRYLEKKVGKDYNVLVKCHPFIYRYANRSKSLKERLIPDYIDTNQLLSAVDLLITDYSSIFFDFLVTNRPIIFYMWDKDDYLSERETYFSNDELPGPVITKIKEVVSVVKDIESIKGNYRLKYDQYKSLFTNYDDGNVTKRLIEYLFNKKNKLKVMDNLDKKKEKIIFYPGGLKNNGITSAFLNLLDNIDYEKYDVSCFVNPTKDEIVIKNLMKISKNIRLLFKFGSPFYTINENYRDRLVKNRGVHRKREEILYPEKAYKREVKRLFGNSNFDYAIDYSGYSFFWAKYIVSIDAKKKICYMHSDMLADSQRTVNGKKPHKKNLEGLFSIYNKFDTVVSVSKSTMEVNKKNLSVFVEESRFDYVMNSMNYLKIIENSKLPIDEEKVIEPPNKNNINFVTMGRLSPEKGQDNLIRAFKLFHIEHKNSRLYIIGDGDLREELENLALDLDIDDFVFFTGQLENPFPLLNACDCFVLSSHYEGQPMVLLESLVLRKNIIATNIIANRFVLENGKYGILVNDSVEGLLNGFLEYVKKGNISHEAIFDYETYNREVIKSFNKMLKS